MRIALHDGAVHESAGVALVGVADDVAHRVVLRAAAEAPFQAGREPSSAASPQPGLFDPFDDRLRVHPEHLGEAGVAIDGDEVLDVVRIDLAGVAQRDSELLGVEGDILVVGDALAALGVCVEQSLDDATLQDRLGHDLPHVLVESVEPHCAVENALGFDDDEWPLLAESVASAQLQLHPVLGPLLAQLSGERLGHLHAAVGPTPGAPAHGDAGLVGIPGRPYLLPKGRQLLR